MVIVLCITAIILALFAAFYNFRTVKLKPDGTAEMHAIALRIQSGAIVFLKREYSTLIKVAAIVWILISAFIHPYVGAAFLIGLVVSTCPCWFGMISATTGNVRVTEEARVSKKLSNTVCIAIQAASVMGLSVGAFSILGCILIYIIFYNHLNGAMLTNWFGFEFQMFRLVGTALAVGCSFIAMFARIGGGIFTKAADMGADLVGKVIENLPEDDARNPATIADNVGDCVGDVAGLGSDICESYVSAIMAAVLLGVFFSLDAIVSTFPVTLNEIKTLCLYPIGVSALGLISCILAMSYVITSKMSDENPQKDLNKLTTISATLIAVSTLVFTAYTFKGFDFDKFGFNYGILSPWICLLSGIISGIAIGKITEYYTSADYGPTQKLAFACKQGPAVNVVGGIALGMKSCFAPSLVLFLALEISNSSAGHYGVAMAAVGMLSFVATTVTIDTYGPISDNAGGIAEMAHLEPAVRAITDKADAAGNTTAAIGKGFAIGSASFATLGMIMNYVGTYNPDMVLNILNIHVLGGLIVGGALTFYFSGLLFDEVSKAAGSMVQEVKRQFDTIAGLREGKGVPLYDQCIKISTEASLKGMTVPSTLGIIAVVVGGFVFGQDFVGALLMGATVTAIQLALYCGNAGGTWDNAKKFIESGGVPDEGKGTFAHQAAVVGDTVGDPHKDTVGPSLDIMIKIMANISVITSGLYGAHNLIHFLAEIF